MYKLIIQILVIAGAINWGLISLQNIDIVKTLVGSGPIEKYIKLAIGAAGIYYAYMIYNNESIESFMTADSLKELIKKKKTEHFGWGQAQVQAQISRAQEQARQAQEQIRRAQEQAQAQIRRFRRTERFTDEEELPNSVPAQTVYGRLKCPQTHPKLIGNECYLD